MWPRVFQLVVLFFGSTVYIGALPTNNDNCPKSITVELRERFSGEQIQRFCQSSIKWTEATLSRTAGQDDAKVSEWLTTVRECQGSDCLQNVVKCSGNNCHKRKFIDGSNGIAGSAGPPGPPTKHNIYVNTVPFPDHTQNIEYIFNFDVENLDADFLTYYKSNDCTTRTWLSNVCALMKVATNAEVFYDVLQEVNGTVGNNMNKNEMEKQYYKYKTKCNEFLAKLAEKGRNYKDVEGCWVDPRAFRKEIRMLTDDERQRFFNAVNQLKREYVEGVSKYDAFVIYHSPANSPGAHFGPAFLPFHREFLKQFEVALRQVDPTVALPYWDSTLDNDLPSPKDSILWTADFLGNGDGVVREGPFANWTATAPLRENPGSKFLQRNVGNGFKGLYQESDVRFALDRESYKQLTRCMNQFEAAHGMVHEFVGGYMSDIVLSPNDPSFFLHHCFVDYIWEAFRQQQSEEERQSDYPADADACTVYHKADGIMKPFGIKNRDGLSERYISELFSYQPRPTCSRSHPDCNSKYLFCDTKRFRCLSTIKSGGNCTGFNGTKICYNGNCENGVCRTA